MLVQLGRDQVRRSSVVPHVKCAALVACAAQAWVTMRSSLAPHGD